ncbi:hypothetical protein [Aeromonas rivipollensis]|uniref:hypothetical protein n=1 Tax=Aeromonas rivipollensis TaxID=948519 RepID=UPI003D1D3D45
MKRYDCTMHDKRGAFGLCMEARSEGQFVPFTKVEQLQAKIFGLLEERNGTGLAIDKAILSGIVPEQHPLRSRLERLANHRKRKQALADGMVALADRCKLLADLLHEARTSVDQVSRWGRFDHDEGCGAEAALLLERIDIQLAGQVPALVNGRTITEGQEFELTTVLQSIANGFSDDPAHDAAALLKRITGEVPWTGDSFQLPPHQGGEPCAAKSVGSAVQAGPPYSQQRSLTGQVFAGLSAATILSGLDRESAADVAQLMLDAAEAKGDVPCAIVNLSSNKA